jgi:hypothetical protein
MEGGGGIESTRVGLIIVADTVLSQLGGLFKDL